MPSLVPKRNGVGTESVRRWNLQAQIDGGQRRGAMTPLRMATWQREREGRPVLPGELELIGYADAGSVHVDQVH
jgi:hypothetical protein